MYQRYVLTDYESASAATREIYDEFMRFSGAAKPPVWVTSLGHNSTLMRAYWEKTKGCLLTGVLPYVLKEMVVFVVSRENGAAYCTACHAHAVLQMDPTLSYNDLVTILDPGGSVPLPPAHRAAVDFAARMARDPNAMRDDDFRALEKVGFDEAEVMELLSVIDLAMMFNCYTSAMQLPLDPQYKEMLTA